MPHGAPRRIGYPALNRRPVSRSYADRNRCLARPASHRPGLAAGLHEHFEQSANIHRMEIRMHRLLLIAALLLPCTVQAASLKDFELTRALEKVALESSKGTPRAINEDILDQGYTVEGTELINHLSVRPSHAAQMRGNPDSVRNQLGSSVCSNAGFRQLLERGAILRYEFSELGSNLPVTRERFSSDDCAQ